MTIWILISALLNSMQSMMFVCIMFGMRKQLKLNMFFTCKKNRENALYM